MDDQARPVVIDADGHVVEPADMWAQYLDEPYRRRAPRPAVDDRGNPCQVVGDRIIMRHAMLLTSGSQYDLEGARILPGGWDPQRRLQDLDREGIDAAVLFPSISSYFSEVDDPLLAAALCRAYNNWLAHYCQAAPDRLIGVALLPLIDIDESIRELTRSVEHLDFKGAFFRPNPCGGRPIHHPAYEPLWEAAESLGVPITVHEGLSDTLSTLGRNRFSNSAILHILSHPFEQMSACAGLILTGVLDRHPSLRFAFLESGTGWLSYWLERMDSHWETWPKLLPAVRMKPSDYFRRQCVIATNPDDALVAAVVDRVGDGCVVWSSGYPHPDAHFSGAVTKSLETMKTLAPSSQQKIFATNAARLYGLEQ